MEKEKLITRNMPLAVYVAKKYKDTGMELDDLIGTAYLGLCRAADTYDKGTDCPKT